MENAWQLFLRQLASADPEFTYDDVCGWSTDEFDALTGAGLISEIAQSTHLVCDVCPETHREQVRWSDDGMRAFTACSVAGATEVNLERLRRWRTSHSQFSGELAKGLTLSGNVQALAASRLWFLGRRRIGERTPYFFFAAIGPDELPSSMESVREAYGRVTAVLLVPFSPSHPNEDGKLRVVDVTRITSAVDRHMVVDLSLIEEQFGAEASPKIPAKRAPRSLRDHRLTILRAYMGGAGIQNMDALAINLHMDRSVIYGMVRGDKSKYGESRLSVMLTKIGCSREKWDRVPAPARRS